MPVGDIKSLPRLRPKLRLGPRLRSKLGLNLGISLGRDFISPTGNVTNFPDCQLVT